MTKLTQLDIQYAIQEAVSVLIGQGVFHDLLPEPAPPQQSFDYLLGLRVHVAPRQGSPQIEQMAGGFTGTIYAVTPAPHDGALQGTPVLQVARDDGGCAGVLLISKRITFLDEVPRQVASPTHVTLHTGPKSRPVEAVLATAGLSAVPAGSEPFNKPSKHPELGNNPDGPWGYITSADSAWTKARLEAVKGEEEGRVERIRAERTVLAAEWDSAMDKHCAADKAKHDDETYAQAEVYHGPRYVMEGGGEYDIECVDTAIRVHESVAEIQAMLKGEG